MSARRSLWLAALLAAAPAQALAQDMCASLDRIAAASRERVPFASLVQAAREGTLVPGYDAGHCMITPESAVICWRRIAPESLLLSVMEPLLRGCLGRAPILRPDRQPRAYGEPDLVFTRRGLRYALDTECTPYCAVGMMAHLAITIEPRRRPRR